MGSVRSGQGPGIKNPWIRLILAFIILGGSIGLLFQKAPDFADLTIIDGQVVRIERGHISFSRHRDSKSHRIFIKGSGSPICVEEAGFFFSPLLDRKANESLVGKLAQFRVATESMWPTSTADAGCRYAYDISVSGTSIFTYEESTSVYRRDRNLIAAFGILLGLTLASTGLRSLFPKRLKIKNY